MGVYGAIDRSDEDADIQCEGIPKYQDNTIHTYTIEPLDAS